MKKFFSVLLVCVSLVFFCSSLLLFFKKTSGSSNTDNQTIADWSNITISCLGDSVTEGLQLNDPYPKVLQKQLGAKFCYNYGIGGSTCGVVEECSCHPTRPEAHYPMVNRFSLIRENSDIIIVMCGINDSAYVSLGTIDSTDTTTFYGAMNTMCKGLKEKYKNSWIFFMTSFKYDHYDIMEYVNTFGDKRVDYYVTAVKNICAKYSIDVFDTFNEVPIHSESDTLDNCHPNQEFVSSVWVPAIAQYLKTNYKQK